MIKEYQLTNPDRNFMWFDVCELDSNDAAVLKSEHSLGADILAYVTDRYERPHYDYDIPTQSELIIYDVPKSPDADQQHFTAMPITFLYRGGALFTFHTAEANPIIDRWKNDKILLATSRPIAFILRAMLLITKQFQSALTTLNSRQKQLDVNLSSDIDNKLLLALSEVDKGLIYIENAAKQNLLLLESIERQTATDTLTKVEREMLADVLIEARQATRTARIVSEVTARIMDTSNTVLNNNLNDTMKFLTIWSLAMTVPTIITGFYGMNVSLPLANQPLAWLEISVGTIGLVVILLWYLRHRRIL